MNHATARCGRGSCGANLGPWNASSRPATSSTHLRSLWSPRAPASPEGGRTHLWPGDTLVLYTDGLIARRTRDIGAGLDGLAALASRCAGASLEELCARLLCMALDASDPPDDLTVILL